MANSHCKGKGVGEIVEAIFANSVPQTPKKSVGRAGDSVDSIHNRAEIMCLLLVSPEIIYRDNSPLFMFV